MSEIDEITLLAGISDVTGQLVNTNANLERVLESLSDIKELLDRIVKAVEKQD